MPHSKTVRFRRLKGNKQALWAGQTRTKSNTVFGKVKVRTETVYPRIGKLATPKKGEKGKCKGSPYYGEIPRR